MHVYLSVLVTTPTMTYVSGIKCGNTDLALTARVIHLWSVPDRTNPAIHVICWEYCGNTDLLVELDNQSQICHTCDLIFLKQSC